MKVTIKAMSLPGKYKAQLAEKLIESLEQESIEKIWMIAAKKRRDEVRNGHVKPIQGKKTLEQVRKIVKDKLIIKLAKSSYSLEELLSRITSENIHESIDTSAKRGKEIW